MPPKQGLPSEIERSIREQEQKLLTEGMKLGRFRRIRQREFYSRYLFLPGKGAIFRAGEFQLFTTIEGGTGQGYNQPLTERETNWPQTGKLSSQQNLVVKALHVRICRCPTDSTLYPAPPNNFNPDLPYSAADIYNIAYNFTVNVKYITEKIPYGLIADFPAVGGAWGFNQASRQQPIAGQPAPPIVQNVGLSQTLDLQAAPLLQSVQGTGNYPILNSNVVAAFERRFKVPLLIQNSEQFTVSLETSNEWQMDTDVANAPPNNGILRNGTGAFEIEVGLWATESFVEQS